MRLFCSFYFLICSVISFSQGTTSFYSEDFQPTYAFINANIHADTSSFYENGKFIIKGKTILKVGNKDLKLPQEAIIIDLKGKHIYPSFIDLDSDFGLSNSKIKPSNKPQYNNLQKGPTAINQALNAQYEAISNFSYNEETAKVLRKKGIGVVLTHVHDGISRGTGALVALDMDDNLNIYKEQPSNHFSFKKGSSTQEYPSSLMGSMALLRQTFHDAEWYKNTSDSYVDIHLGALNKNDSLIKIIEIPSYKQLQLIKKLNLEFNYQFIIKTQGDCYKSLNQVQQLNMPLIVPINFPKPYNVYGPLESRYVSYKEAKHWELSPYNIAFLLKKNIDLTITSNKNKDFLKSLRSTYIHGASKKELLAALTETPARLMKQSEVLGKLKENYYANFIITDKDLFNEAIIIENWVNGKKYNVNNFLDINIEGNYEFKILGRVYKATIKNNITPEISFKLNDEKSLVLKGHRKNNFISFSTGDSTSLFPENIQLDASIYGNGGLLEGRCISTRGEIGRWSAVRASKNTIKTKKDSISLPDSTKILYPFNAYGVPKQKQKNAYILITNTTIWTSNDSGDVLKNQDILLGNGKIASISKGIPRPVIGINDTLIVIDGSEKHLTPGIIDEHSHIGIMDGVNEIGESSTAEVRIEDALDPDDINIYRQLAGGVTTSQLLHGSANPIGGQSALIKLKWGEPATEMLIHDAPKFIKFALGENVKQSNWGDQYHIRFPQTRMGVESLYYDLFNKASKYNQEHQAYNKLSKVKKNKTIPPRIDLDLEALGEILNNERFITCHSYVQSEILMLMKVADSLGFTLNTFTHILEGYKVADQMKKHGAGASTFSDWWAYKYEVKDAIPYNAAILNNKGIITAINSDDAEMGRRLNQEAAKAIKYGNVSEIDALKMVTINPAQLLHIDNRTGSIEVGKDADLVLWDNHPLSMQAKVLKTIIEGKIYYDSKISDEISKKVKLDKLRIISEMQKAIKNGTKAKKLSNKKKPHYHCDTLEY